MAKDGDFLAKIFAAGDRVVDWLDRELQSLGLGGTLMLAVMCFSFYSVIDLLLYLGSH